MRRHPENADPIRTMRSLSLRYRGARPAVVGAFVRDVLARTVDRLGGRYYRMVQAALAARAPDDPHLSQQSPLYNLVHKDRKPCARRAISLSASEELTANR
jgi:hypothetical protein